ncbi:hypothetical protein ASZ90_015482 [hydrocarbon metagenome]|uniref:Uncharacterized protein n=1 Tax=hydrocarbon metagenome TaxID=938273 RepID=A0A0W8F1U8_9ZZZZ
MFRAGTFQPDTAVLIADVTFQDCVTDWAQGSRSLDNHPFFPTHPLS